MRCTGAECAVPPPTQKLRGNDVASVCLGLVASDDEDAPVASESVTIFVMIVV